VTNATVGRRSARAALVVASGLGPVLLVITTPLLETPFAGAIWFASGLGSFALAYYWRLHRDSAFLYLWVGISMTLAVVSVLSGRWNGLTDEPYGMPGFLRLWPNLYGSPLQITYYQYGAGPFGINSYYVYLPLLLFVQVPGLDYRWVAVAAWALTVFFVRKIPASALLLGAPWVALLAASGFNDFIPLAALTGTFVVLSSWRSRLAEAFSLGLKQFANVIVVVYHLWHRRWKDALLATAITAAILAPFAYLDPMGVWCHAILLGPVGCSGSGGFSSVGATVSHVNYFLWPAWVIAVFGPRYIASLRDPSRDAVRAEARADVARIRRTESGAVPEALVLLAAPYVQLRAAVRSIHPELWTAGKFCAVGAAGVGVNLLVFTLARDWLGPSVVLTLVASGLAFCVATAWNFSANYVWTFRDLHSRPVLHHGVGFFASALIALSANLVVLYLLEGTVSAPIAQFLGILAGTAFSFSLNRGVNFPSARQTTVP
jgi:putative flippase GtrA